MQHIVCSKKIDKRGITLIETLLVIGVLAVLAVTGTNIYRNYSKNVELEANASAIISDLKSVQSKAINGEEELKWGIHFVNGADDYYEIFSTATDYTGASVKRTVRFTDSITFSTPGEGENYDILFNKIRGTVDTEKQVVLTFEGTNKTITVTTIGTIY